MNSSSKKYLKKLYQQIAFSKKSQVEQVLQKPIHNFSYIFNTRIPLYTQQPINGTAQLFFGKKIKGIFPDSVFGYLYLYGFSEEDLTGAFITLVKEGMTVLDIGAHVGYFSALASFLVGKSGKVHAFEATPRTYELLKDNMQQFKNVTTNHAAVWSKKKDLEFFDYGPFYAQCNSFTKAKLTKEILQKVKPEKLVIQTITIDEYCKSHRIKPNFIKIDAESAEYEILQGMTETIQKYKPMLSLEVGDLRIKGKKNSKDCIYFLKKLGYKPYNYINDKFVEHTIKKDYYDIFDNLIFIHTSQKI